MIDLEQLLVITLGSLVIANFAAALLLTFDWPRIRHFYAVVWDQMDADNRAFFVWFGRVVWCTVLIAAAA